MVKRFSLLLVFSFLLVAQQSLGEMFMGLPGEYDEYEGIPTIQLDNTQCSGALSKDIGSQFWTEIPSAYGSKWYKLRPDDLGQLRTTISLLGGQPQVDYDLELYKSCSGSVIDSSRRSGASENMYTRVTERNYYARVFSPTGDYGSRVKFRTSFSACDKDGDGYDNHDAQECEETDEDCNDDDSNIHPGANEVCDGKDNDCDGQTDEGLTNCCGDGKCDTQEHPGKSSHCRSDCYQKFELTFLDPPIEANTGDNVPVKVKVKNIGTITGTTYVSASILPSDWTARFNKAPLAGQATTASNIPFRDCCPEESFVERYVVGDLAKGQETTITFTQIAAQDSSTTSPCDGNAWHTSFKLFAGEFDGCGENYNTKISKDFTIKECKQTSGCDGCLDLADGTAEANKCDCGAECSSNSCGGEDQKYHFKCKDGENGASQFKYTSKTTENSCGGQGYNWPEETSDFISCGSDEGGCQDCICDEDHDDIDRGEFSEGPCRVKLGGSCQLDKDCWNDDGGNFCSSKDKCSDGVEGRDCGSSNDCLSKRCVNQKCGAKLANWESCSVSANCQSNVCLSGTCRPASTICGDGHCEDGRGETADNCRADCFTCEIPDGKSADCQCFSDPHCKNTDYFCKKVSGWNPCVKKANTDECSNKDKFMCLQGDVYKCISNGKFYEKKLIQPCGSGGRFCDATKVEDTGKCSTYANGLTVWLDHAAPLTNVNKQPGDKGEFNIYTTAAATVNIQYNSDIFTSSCARGSKTIQKGITTCDITVKDDAEVTTTQITADNAAAQATIIDNPKFLIATNSEKLNQRFSAEKDGVSSLLKQAYTNAATDGVVYDLSHYNLGTHPFSTFTSYNERIGQPYMLDNTYSLEVSRFIKEKCTNCKDVILLGDDFVVPSYRRGIPIHSWSLRGKSIDDNPIQTDILYIKREGKPFSEFDDLFVFKGKFEGKPVKFIYPDSISSELKQSITDFKQTLQNKYKPETEHILPGDVSCNDVSFFSKLKGSTVIVIGTEENNKAFTCFPFVASEENENTVGIEVSPWDTKNYALAVNTDELFVMKNLDIQISSGAYKSLTGKKLYYVEIGLDAAAYAALLADVVIATPFIPIDFIGDGIESLNDCLVRGQALYCKISLAAIGIPFIPSKAIKKVIKEFIKKGGTFAEKFVAKHTSVMVHFFSELARKGKIGQFTDAFKNAGKHGEDIFNFFRTSVSKFDNTLKPGKNAEDFFDNALSPQARQVADGNVKGNKLASDALSEGASFKIWEDRGMGFVFNEADMKAIIGDGNKIGVDFVGNLGGKRTGVSVTRSFDNPKGAFDNPRGGFEKTLNNKVTDIVSQKGKYPASHKWKDSVVHIIAESATSKQAAEEIAEKMVGENSIDGIQNVKFVITEVPNQAFIFGGGIT